MTDMPGMSELNSLEMSLDRDLQPPVPLADGALDRGLQPPVPLAGGGQASEAAGPAETVVPTLNLNAQDFEQERQRIDALQQDLVQGGHVIASALVTQEQHLNQVASYSLGLQEQQQGLQGQHQALFEAIDREVASYLETPTPPSS